jgi:hypothetical protein
MEFERYHYLIDLVLYLFYMLTNTLGKLNINPIMYLLLISMIITPFYTYHMAVSTKQ